MYVLEKAITKPYWEPIRLMIQRRVDANLATAIGRTGVKRVPCFGDSKAYVICDNKQVVGWIYLIRKKNWIGWEVTQTFVMPNYRGLGYAERIYRAAVNGDKILLISGISHTKYSKSLWAKFVQKETFDIWAQDLKQPSTASAVLYDDGALVSNLDIYHLPYTKKDVRLIARNKQK